MTDTKAKVFISHSGWDGIVEKFFGELKIAFGDDFEPLYDMEHIGGGDDLDQRVADLIGDSDAALVVVDQRALDSEEHPWVLAEANWLRGTRPNQVIPVLIDGVDPSKLKEKNWEPTGLHRTVAVAATAEGSETEQLSRLARAVVEALQPTLTRVRTSKATKQLADILSVFPETVLTHAAEKLKPSGQWSERHLAREVAGALIAAAKNDAPGPFGIAMQVLQKLAETDLDRAGRALDIVVPFTWVDGDVAAQIPGAVVDGRYVGLGVRAVGAHTAYVIRSEAIWPPDPVHAVEPGSDTEYVNLDEDLEKALKWVPPESPEVTLLAIVCDGSIDPVLVEKVAEHVREFRGIRIVLLIGELGEADVPQSLRDRLALIRPSLAAEEETKGLSYADEGYNSLTYHHERGRPGKRLRAVGS
ncbi:MAG TPA: toll/interleukin-1 receptor domain-containing protein [Solirubrobacteraceae bacterium]|nr:toll/interleukin-1 receptor domain-containing protein [Solirubrobacteraceae bacterium]